RGASQQSLLQAKHVQYCAAHVAEALRHAAAIDRMIKGLVKGDVWDELLRLALRFASPPLSPARPRAARGQAVASGARIALF
ncbi:MAG TPA: hypothetical protein VM937_05110, partial [Burkholderiaceae bacterium]|nr:hypothetical protein [Burkholderiaceae bacterium]